jgi:putative glutamine amidotransferase
MIASALSSDIFPFMFVSDISKQVVHPHDLEVGDTLVLWGGGDIHPSLYNRERSITSGAGKTLSRYDELEWALLQRAISLKIPIIGVCRGAQMLCAAGGGYLIQHVNGHAGYSHPVYTKDGERMMVNSYHHQMMVLPEDAVLLAWSDKLSDEYHDEDRVLDYHPQGKEPEAALFKSINAIGVQWHPEWMEENCEATKTLERWVKECL